MGALGGIAEFVLQAAQQGAALIEQGDLAVVDRLHGIAGLLLFGQPGVNALHVSTDGGDLFMEQAHLNRPLFGLALGAVHGGAQFAGGFFQIFGAGAGGFEARLAVSALLIDSTPFLIDATVFFFEGAHAILRGLKPVFEEEPRFVGGGPFAPQGFDRTHQLTLAVGHGFEAQAILHHFALKRFRLSFAELDAAACVVRPAFRLALAMTGRVGFAERGRTRGFALTDFAGHRFEFRNQFAKARRGVRQLRFPLEQSAG
jgi:hypothetical protein